MHVGGRHYNYVYRAWNFNFHHRGKVGERYSDFFACVPLVPGQKLDLAQAFVIPWEAISGKTFYLPDSRRSYAGKFATYRNAWDQIRRGEPASRPAIAVSRRSAHFGTGEQPAQAVADAVAHGVGDAHSVLSSLQVLRR